MKNDLYLASIACSRVLGVRILSPIVSWKIMKSSQLRTALTEAYTSNVTHQLKTHKKSAENEFLFLVDLDESISFKMTRCSLKTDNPNPFKSLFKAAELRGAMERKRRKED